MPARLEGYARRALGAAGGRVSGLPTSVVTYAYELDPHARDGLTRLVRLAFGAASVVDVDAPIRYGDEDDYAAGRGAESAGLQGCLVGVMNLGATPEAENHGIVLTSWRDRVANARGSARLLFVVDEGPYLRRLGGDPSLAARVEERRDLWRSFARACGVPVLLTDLGRVDGTATANAETIAALNVALWPADHR